MISKSHIGQNICPLHNRGQLSSLPRTPLRIHLCPNIPCNFCFFKSSFDPVMQDSGSREILVLLNLDLPIFTACCLRCACYLVSSFIFICPPSLYLPRLRADLCLLYPYKLVPSHPAYGIRSNITARKASYTTALKWKDMGNRK